MKLQSITRIAILVAALAGPAVAAPAASASADDDHGGGHHCPAGFESQRAQTGAERAADRNGDGTVCVRESEDGDREIRDDVH